MSFLKKGDPPLKVTESASCLDRKHQDVSKLTCLHGSQQHALSKAAQEDQVGGC